MIRYVNGPHLILRISSAAAVGVMAAGCSHPQHANSTAPIPAPAATRRRSFADVDDAPAKTPVKNSLVELLEEDARTDHVFPSGVQVKGVSIEDGVATIDFSHEFSELANSGETVESDAQHALRRALSRFATIEKMRVTVDGKPFESQATDWNTPFRVRDADRDKTRKTPPVGSDSASR